MTTPTSTSTSTRPGSEHRRAGQPLPAAARPPRRAEAARPPPRRLPAVLDRAATEKLSLTAALERLLALEVDATEARRLAGRLRFASLPTPATLEEFDYDAQPAADRALIHELATCRYLDTATNVLLIGPPGRG